MTQHDPYAPHTAGHDPYGRTGGYDPYRVPPSTPYAPAPRPRMVPAWDAHGRPALHGGEPAARSTWDPFR